MPAYLLVRRGPAPVVGIIAMLALPDLAVKALNGTPQGVALPLFLLALYFAVHRRRKGFVATAVAILFTHHLTGLITLVLYYAMWVLPRSRDRGFLRGEWPYLLFFSAWPLYWAWTFSNTGQWYMAPILLVLTVAIGLPIAVVLYLAAPHTRRAVDWAGARAAALSPLRLVALAVGVAAAGLLLSGVTLETPGLSTAGLANRLVVALYAVLLVIAGAAILARRDHGLALFAAILLALGSAVVGMGCQHVFDSLRVVDYVVLGGLATLFAPGLSARWMSRSLLLTVAVVVVLAGGFRLANSYDRLFVNTDGQIEAARWVKANTPDDVSIASDTKMSLLILGEGGRNATFEGTWWLFDDSPVTPYIAALNGDDRFLDRPIRYVLVSDYMLERGAEVTWFTSTLKPSFDLPLRMDTVGERVYEQGGVTVWELDPIVAFAGSESPDDLFSWFYGHGVGRLCR